eukprot:Clim_evm29s88 gene=Clim_evmTU29s88
MLPHLINRHQHNIRNPPHHLDDGIMFDQPKSSMFAHSRIRNTLFVLSAIELILVFWWILGYRGGLSWADDALVFNWHPVLMTLGMLILYGHGATAYRLYTKRGKVNKAVHGALHGAALFSAVIGLMAVFRFHNSNNIPNMYSLHSWVGILTVILFAGQWLAGFLVFALPYASQDLRSELVGFHRLTGQVMILLVTCTIMMGILEKITFLEKDNSFDKYGDEAMLANFIGVNTVCLGVTLLAAFKQRPIHTIAYQALEDDV